jgi:hypothetical protein
VLGYQEQRYYRHTGRAPFVGTTVAALAAWVTVTLLGVAYGYADLYVKVYDIISFLILAAFAVAMGFAVYAILKWGKVRNMLVVAIIALSAGLLGWYASWVAWEYALLTREASAAPTLWEIAQRPRGVYELAAFLNTRGTFSLRGRVITGVELWIAWGIEALTLVGATALIPIRGLREQAFCENCQAWTRRQRGVLRLGHGDEDTLRRHVEAKNFDHFVRLGLVDRDRPVHLRVDLFDCARCDQTHLMSVSRVTVPYNGKNQRQESATTVLDRLWLSADEAERVRAIAEQPSAEAAQPVPALNPPAVPPAPPSGAGQQPPDDKGSSQ